MYTTKKLPSTNMAPGSLRVPEGAVCPTVLQAIRYTPETCEEQEFASVAEAVAWQAGKGVLWLNINGLGNADFLLGMNTELGLGWMHEGASKPLWFSREGLPTKSS